MAITVCLREQKTGNSKGLYQDLNRLLRTPGLKSVRFCVAYARWDGIGLISESLESFLSNGGSFDSIFGAGNGVTTPDALYYGLALGARFPGRTYAGFVEDTYQNAIFHPKIYEFRFENEVVALLGSANLTGGGLSRNSELGAELRCPMGQPFEKQLADYWIEAKKTAKAVSLAEIRRLASSAGAGSERRDEVGGAKKGKPYLTTGVRTAPKPLFAQILNLPNFSNDKKLKLLAEMDALSDKPTHLYLQIFARETGGSKGKSGTAVQLPVGTLGAYFGLRDDEERMVTFRFPSEEIASRITHFSNSTHQVRLSPIMTVNRPAILHLERAGEDLYSARFVPASAYNGTLESKCPNQTRKGARRWGVF
ncbi:phospholipase D family protein [Sphingomonas sp. SM33]|uniref:Phospholipase D family protein n=1 Tax=Sphingomonas telluris TaxID=2907998 RepID=A0ABS9VMZ2_9SPHN|nr:phospholipase D family protein [Sphingomonas telluris]MCH8616351.1 phospholipase D family protein [Sphingomonas telluris]